MFFLCISLIYLYSLYFTAVTVSVYFPVSVSVYFPTVSVYFPAVSVYFPSVTAGKYTYTDTAGKYT